MDSIHKTAMVDFLRAFHTNVQHASKLSKSLTVHIKAFSFIGRWSACYWTLREKAGGELLAQKCQTTMKLFHKELIYAHCSLFRAHFKNMI